MTVEDSLNVVPQNKLYFALKVKPNEPLSPTFPWLIFAAHLATFCVSLTCQVSGGGA